MLDSTTTVVLIGLGFIAIAVVKLATLLARKDTFRISLRGLGVEVDISAGASKRDARISDDHSGGINRVDQ